MPQMICPNCQRIVTFMADNCDVVHECNSGNSTLDQDDELNIDRPGWNRLGAANKASPKARIMGEDVNDKTSRGTNSALYRQKQHDEYIKIR